MSIKNNEVSMYKSEVKGKNGIVARVVAKSSNKNNPDSIITTFEVEYHRFIHGEIMTHRLFSRNAMSSRAVPISKMLEQVRENPATPIHWGANQSGMQADSELTGESLENAKRQWKQSAIMAAGQAEIMQTIGAHKQIVNRLLEPFQMMKTVITTTELDNFFWLRCHKDAQPEIQELARCMYEAYNDAESELLNEDEWHTPYVEHFRSAGDDALLEYHSNNLSISEEDALKVSASCCAQVSYRVLDDSLDKALMIYDKLINSVPVHASPVEHVAKPMKWDSRDNIYGMHSGETHVDKSNCIWSGNLKGWVQYRQLIDNNTCWNYTEEQQ